MRGGAAAIAIGAVSALGTGRDAYATPAPGSAATVAIKRDPALEAALLKRPFAARAPMDLGDSTSDDRAVDLLMAALTGAIAGLDAARPAWRRERIGIAIGTSSGGMITAERFFAARASGDERAMAAHARGATYFAPLDRAIDALDLGSAAIVTQVLAACAASAIAVGIGARWLARGACDVVLAGGYDGLSVFVAAGFEVLRATTASSPKPFREGRDGMSLGEGAGVVALVRGDDLRGAEALARFVGFGASNDAVHITAPDRTGSGLARAAKAALDDAAWGAANIDLVSAHGTSTPYNDAMEARAIATALDAPLGSARAIVHPFKAQIGHTLGAAGVLEALAAADALATGVAPPSAGSGPLDPDTPARLLDRAEVMPMRGALKLAAAFGGSNAALAIAPPSFDGEGRSRALRPVHLVAAKRVISADLAALAEVTGVARDRLARLDELCRLGLSAVAALAGEVGRDALAGAGIVAGHALATIDTNDLFDAKKRQKGAAWVDPRLFPATSPNAIAGECAIVYKLTGPSFSVGAGLDGGVEALARAAELVAAGDADHMVVVAADDSGPAGLDLLRCVGASHRPLARGAVAVLVASEPGERALREVPLDLSPAHRGDGPIGHLSLVERLAALGLPI